MLNIRHVLFSKHSCTSRRRHVCGALLSWLQVCSHLGHACSDTLPFHCLTCFLELVSRCTGAVVWSAVTTRCLGQLDSEEVEREGVISEVTRGHAAAHHPPGMNVGPARPRLPPQHEALLTVSQFYCMCLIIIFGGKFKETCVTANIVLGTVSRARHALTHSPHTKLHKEQKVKKRKKKRTKGHRSQATERQTAQLCCGALMPSSLLAPPELTSRSPAPKPWNLGLTLDGDWELNLLVYVGSQQQALVSSALQERKLNQCSLAAPNPDSLLPVREKDFPSSAFIFSPPRELLQAPFSTLVNKLDIRGKWAQNHFHGNHST